MGETGLQVGGIEGQREEGETGLLMGGRGAEGGGRGQREEGSKHPHASVSTAFIIHPGGTEFYICDSFHDNMFYCSTLNIGFWGAGKLLLHLAK